MDRGTVFSEGTVNEIHRKIVPSMYAAIPKDVISASVYDKERMIGTGLAILDRDYAGIYAIHVAENYRGLHIGRSICLALLNAAAEQGASLRLSAGCKRQPACQKLIPFFRF